MKIKDSKLLLKILSALAAIVLWFAITYTEDPIINQTLTDISIVFEGEKTLHENGLIVVNKDTLPDISAVIRGNRSSVISSVGSVSAVVDLSEIKSAGQNTVTIKYNYPSSSVVLAKTKTRELTIETEKIVTRNIPVNVAVENADKNAGFMVDATSNIDKIRVSGAESIIYKIAYAKASVDVTNITVGGESEYFYQLCDADGAVLPEKNILSKSETVIPVKNVVYTKVSLPVKVVLPENMARDFAIEVKVQDKTSVYAGVSEGFAEEALYAVYAGGEAAAGNEYKMKLQLPEGVYVPEESREIIAVCTLIPKVLKEIEVPVVAENVPEGKKVKLTQEKIRISVKGAENLLEPGNIKATIDASKLKVGEKAALEVELSSDEEIQVVGSYTASAILE